MTNKALIAIVLAASLLLSVVGIFTPRLPKAQIAENTLGATGNLLAENYIPYVMYNGGFNSAKDFKISGSSSFTGAVALTSTFTLGSSGTAASKLIWNSCALIYSNKNVTASTTKTFDCAVTGATDGDIIVGSFSTTTPATGGGWMLNGVSASTTSGYITWQITNWTGADAALPREIASSSRYVILDN